MKALYRKYRPCALADVVGQEQVTTVLSSSLAQNKISHAYLFIGPRGTGKTSVARIFAHEINNFKYTVEDNYVDIIEIDGASNRGIDNIRELREKAVIAPSQGKFKIYIIDEVHMLTKEAFNALLKTLEEPPEHVVFIMATTDAHKVPVTITSRAQTYTFKLADVNTMQLFLQDVAKKEKINIEKEALEIIAKRGGGSFRDSLSLLDQISTLSEKKITKELVISAMGLPDEQKIAELLKVYIEGDITKITASLQELLATGIRATTAAEEIMRFIIARPEPRLLSLLDKLADVKDPFAEARLLVALTLTIINQTQPQVLTTTDAKPIKNAPTSKPVVKTPAAKPAENISQLTSPTTSTIMPEIEWDKLLEKMQGLSEVIFLQLKKCAHEISGNRLEIYPRTKIVKNILTSPNNHSILINAAGPNIKVTIHEPGEHIETMKNDDAVMKISAIMGGEVQNDNGGTNPF